MAYESKRWYDDPVGQRIMCDYCKHYRLFAKCDAFPDGIPSELLHREEHDTPFPGDNGIRYEPQK